jgi:hypothetical protein
MCVFQLKNFAGDDYKDKQEHAVIDNGPVQFEDVTESVAASLALLPASERENVLASLTKAEAEDLEYNWSFWARPNQLLPPGNWLTWLLLAGRGFGKTRAAAEAVRALVCGADAVKRDRIRAYRNRRRNRS